MKPQPSISVEEMRNVLKVLEAKGVIYHTKTGIYVPTERGWKLLYGRGPIKEEIFGYGFEKIKAENRKQIKFVKNEKVDDSTICIKISKGAKDLKKELKEILKTVSMVSITIEVEEEKEKIVGYGSPALKIESEKSISLRKDEKVEDDTIAILCNKSAKDLKRKLIEKLKNPSVKVKITIEAL